jgi:putative ATPase
MNALEHLIRVAGGDARNALNALELAVESTPPWIESGSGPYHPGVAQESIQRRAVLYDKDGDAHYDTISAFIKSVRGSDPMRPCTGWRRCCMPERTRASSCAA